MVTMEERKAAGLLWTDTEEAMEEQKKARESGSSCRLPVHSEKLSPLEREPI